MPGTVTATLKCPCGAIATVNMSTYYPTPSGYDNAVATAAARDALRAMCRCTHVGLRGEAPLSDSSVGGEKRE